ncbi:MAG: NYN domain-containing protein [Chlamydiae bacterium]|nr:NYN domain-containing protein [Chlamydiota bacterium]
MHYLIDGYNLLFKTNSIKSSLQKQRDGLIQLIKQKSITSKQRMTLVFDGSLSKDESDNLYKYDGFCVIYTWKKLTADEFIIQEIKNAKRPQEYIVVTSDKDLGFICKTLGAKIHSIDEFNSWLYKKKNEAKKPIKSFKDSEVQINRLLKIFEEKLANPDDD